MYRTLLVPLDGSEFSEEALPLAFVLTGKMGAELHLAHVLRMAPDMDFKTPQGDLTWREKIREGAEGYLEGIAGDAREQGLSTLTAVLDGRVVPTLKDYVEEQGVDLVVMTSHGTGGVQRWWLGSVADGLIRTTHADVLLVRPWDDTEDREPTESRFAHLLVPLDGSELAETALESALVLAERFNAQVTLLRVVPAPVELKSIYGVSGVEVAGKGHEERVREAQEYLDAIAARYPGANLQLRVGKSGAPAEGIVDAARVVEADLIVLSSHGRGGVERLVLGSVTDKVVRSTTRPVLVVRREEDE